MNLTIKRAAVVGALCLGLAVAASAGAQDRQGGPGGPPSGQRAGERERMFETFRQKREQRLHDLLQIRPDQETAFRAYMAALQPPRREGDRGARRGEEAQLTTPDRLDRMARRMAERQQRFQQMAAATRTFYAALTPEQRKAFDAMPHHMGREGHFGRHMMMGGHGLGGPPPR